MCHGPSAKPFGLGIVFFFFCSDSCIGIPNRLAWWFFFWISKTIAVFIGDEAIGATTPTEPPTFHSLGSLEGTFQIRLSIDDNGVVVLGASYWKLFLSEALLSARGFALRVFLQELLRIGRH